MSCTTHANHAHAHGKDCGHTVVLHEGHVDYLHDVTCTMCMPSNVTITAS